MRMNQATRDAMKPLIPEAVLDYQEWYEAGKCRPDPQTHFDSTEHDETNNEADDDGES